MDTTDDVLTRIGMDVLEQWHSDSALHTVKGKRGLSTRGIDALLDEKAVQEDGWHERMQETIEGMTSLDFAAHGKNLCLFLLSICKKLQTVESPTPLDKELPPGCRYGETPEPRWLPSIMRDDLY